MILTRELRRNPRPFLVPTGVLTLLAVLLLYPSAVLDGILHGSTGVLRTAPADLIVYARNANGVLILSRLGSEERSQVQDVEGVDRVAAFDAWLLGAASEDAEGTAAVALLSSEAQLGSAAPEPGEALVDTTLREQIDVAEGDTLLIGPGEVPVTVTGFVSELNLWLLPGVIVDKDTWSSALLPAGSDQSGESSSGEVPQDLPDEMPEDLQEQLGDQPGTSDGSSEGEEEPGSEGSEGSEDGTDTGSGASGDEGSESEEPGSEESGESQESATGVVGFAGQEPSSGGAVQEPGSGGAPAVPVDDDEDQDMSQLLFVDVDDGADPTAVAAAIDQATGRVTETFTRSGAVKAMPGVEEQETTFGYIRMVTLTVALVVVGLFLMFLTLERTPFYAVLKAVGASSRQLFFGVVAQALLITAIAVGVGAAATWGLTHIPFELPTMMQPVRLLETLVALGVTTVAGSVLSLRRVTGIDPADAIG